ncbi:MAG TPA: acetamidase/formamidase family protein [Bryobacteraceae bacterium]|nr:acetamidase/formamidase family protein [Bryobacteraceae bacterium]
MTRDAGFFGLMSVVYLLGGTLPAPGQVSASIRRFTRTPYYSGPDDPERGKIRGTLKLGETVIIEVPGDTGDTDLKPGVVPDPNATPPRGSRPGGPFAIEGIKPGDWVAIRIIQVEPGPYGYCNNHGPFRGPLRSLVPVKDGLVHLLPDFVVPVRPMIGVIQLQSAAALPPGTPAWDNGGNFDFNSVKPGSTVYIRAQRYGGMLTIGDTHAYMSDGELTGTGVEIDATVTLNVDRAQGFPTGGVVVETADRWYTAGIGANWEEAVKNAFAEMVALVTQLHNTTVEHANRIVGTIGDVVPGFAAGSMNYRGFQRPSYITCQISIPKSLRRTGQPFQP